MRLIEVQIAMIGCGSMGGGMALLFAEDGVQVGLSDPEEKTMDALIDKAEKAGYHGKLKKYKGENENALIPLLPRRFLVY